MENYRQAVCIVLVMKIMNQSFNNEWITARIIPVKGQSMHHIYIDVSQMMYLVANIGEATR